MEEKRNNSDADDNQGNRKHPSSSAEVIELGDSSDDEDEVVVLPTVKRKKRRTLQQCYSSPKPPPPRPLAGEVIDVDQLASEKRKKKREEQQRKAEEDDEEMEVWGGKGGDDVIEVKGPSTHRQQTQHKGSILDTCTVDGNVDSNNKKDATSNGEGEGEFQVLKSTGPLAFADFPHAREHCLLKPMAEDPLQHCPKCYCWVCDVIVRDCIDWTKHCMAKSSITKWQRARATKQVLEGNRIRGLPTRRSSGVSTELVVPQELRPRQQFLSGPWRPQEKELLQTALEKESDFSAVQKAVGTRNFTSVRSAASRFFPELFRAFQARVAIHQSSNDN